MLVGWFSGGVSSFIACYLYRNKVDKVVYIDIADQHPDTLRFVKECEQFFPCGIDIIRSDKYTNVDDVISKRKYVNGPGGGTLHNIFEEACKIQMGARKHRGAYDIYLGI